MSHLYPVSQLLEFKLPQKAGKLSNTFRQGSVLNLDAKIQKIDHHKHIIYGILLMIRIVHS